MADSVTSSPLVASTWGQKAWGKRCAFAGFKVWVMDAARVPGRRVDTCMHHEASVVVESQLAAQGHTPARA